MGSDLQLLAGTLQPRLDAVAVHPQFVQASPDLELRQAAVSCQIQQPFLLYVELGELLAEGVMQELDILFWSAIVDFSSC